MTSGSMAVRGILLSALCLWSLGVTANDTIRNRMGALELDFPASALGRMLSADSVLPDFYRHRDYALAWSRSEDKDALLDAIAQSEQHGLSPSDYHFTQLSRFAGVRPSDLDAETLADLDMLLTDAALKLASHLAYGKVDPETLQSGHAVARSGQAVADSLAEALASQDVAAGFARFAPNQSDYRKLSEARARIHDLSGEPWPPVPAGPTIRPGMEDERMPLIRQKLQMLGDLPLVGVETGQQGDVVYDGHLVVAVRQFQGRHGLEDDGLIGDGTLAALNVGPSERLTQIDANLERWRWLPDQLGDTHILVNVAGYDLRLVRGNNVVMRSRVIVGRPLRPTPLFSDSIRHLVFNPSWTVPRTIMIEDQLPVIRQNPGYLESMGFSLYRGWGPDRQPVDPASVDWWSLSEDYFPYQLIQEPGPGNALGQVKFMFPNQFDVYLHDTPARHLFRQSQRSFSSGCIRVENSLELARHLLESQSGWSGERLQRVLESRELTTVYLQNPVPVHLEYWTAWVDEAGTLQFREDIYQHNGAVTAALETSLDPGAGIQMHQASAR